MSRYSSFIVGKKDIHALSACVLNLTCSSWSEDPSQLKNKFFAICQSYLLVLVHLELQVSSEL